MSLSDITEIARGGERYKFEAALAEHSIVVSPLAIETLWVNITRQCNQSCVHCHVDASPARQEHMGRAVLDKCLEVLSQYDFCRNVDITGGAPELNPDFDYFVVEARKLGKHVLVRSNITVIMDGNPRTGDSKMYLPEFFADNRVEIIASLPHYTQCITDRIRGRGVFAKSIGGLRLLNAQGYGRAGSGLILNLVYNCDGALSPCDCAGLEDEFKRMLLRDYGIEFNRLFAVTNMPINRFGLWLQRTGVYHEYMQKLVCAFSAAATDELVCRSHISVGYDGRLYDCDFNQMLNLQIGEDEPATIFNADCAALANRRIRFGSHCFGCTAGGGSS